MSTDLLVTLVWTSVSFAFVCLAVYGMSISSQENRDTQEELLVQANRKRPNGILILGLQQASGARFLKWCHRLAFTHQFIGFAIGAYSLYLLLSGSLHGADTPTTNLGPVQEYFIPIAFVCMLLVICGTQIGLIRISHSQRKARLDLRALELAQADEKQEEFIRLTEAMAERIEEIRTESEGPQERDS